MGLSVLINAGWYKARRMTVGKAKDAVKKLVDKA